MISLNDDPTPGFYKTRLRSGAPPVGIRIFFDHPKEPGTDELLTERGKRWQAEMNGKPIDLERVWPQCSGAPITAAEYRYFADSHAHAVEHDPFDPRSTPHRRTDWDTATPTF